MSRYKYLAIWIISDSALWILCVWSLALFRGIDDMGRLWHDKPSAALYLIMLDIRELQTALKGLLLLTLFVAVAINGKLTSGTPTMGFFGRFCIFLVSVVSSGPMQRAFYYKWFQLTHNTHHKPEAWRVLDKFTYCDPMIDYKSGQDALCHLFVVKTVVLTAVCVVGVDLFIRAVRYVRQPEENSDTHSD